MIKCKQFVQDISHDVDGNLRRKFGYRFHYFLCVHCRNYLKQLDLIKSKLIENNQNIEIDAKKVENLENKILQTINKKL
jgi:transcriptional regulatory protein LevR